MQLFTRVLYVAGVIGTASCTRQLAPAPIPAAIMPVVHVSVDASVSGSASGNASVSGAAGVSGAASVSGSVSVSGGASESASASITGSGTGRLVIDVPEGPVPVYRVRFEARKQDNGSRRATFRFFELPQEQICTSTPCVIDEPPGNVLIGFPVLGCRPAVDYDLVHVGLQPSVYRRSLAVFEDDTGAEKILGIVSASLGASAVITGIVLLPVGLTKDDGKSTAIAGGITLGAGALALAAGILMIRHDSATYRPGSANHFEASISAGGTAVAAPSSARSPLEVFPYYDCSWGSRRGGTG